MRLLTIFIFLTTGFIAKSEVRISLLTTTPGQQSHALFGHSAIRVVDDKHDFEKIYNFGWFDFGTPNFPLRVLQGDLEYWLGQQSLENFVKLNNKENRLIHEQVLDLSESQAASIFLDLIENAEDANKYYLYSFTQKNCATEIRDLFMKHNLIGSREVVGMTYRQGLNEFLADHLWYKFGMNALMGNAVDREMTWDDHLFIPKNLERAVAESNGLVKENNQLNEIEEMSTSSFFAVLTSPGALFLVIFIICVFHRPKWLQWVLYLFLGLLGCFSLYLWMTSLHIEMANNFNLLWANPLYLLFLGLFWQKNLQKFLVYLIAGCLFFVPIFWMFGLQGYDFQIIPLLGILILYSVQDLKTLKGPSKLHESLSH